MSTRVSMQVAAQLTMPEWLVPVCECCGTALELVQVADVAGVRARRRGASSTRPPAAPAPRAAS